MVIYRIVENFGSKKVWQIGTQNRLGKENIGRLWIYTEGNEGKTGRLADNTLAY